jgi:hypothetical protein
MCFETAFSDIANGSASAVTRASPFRQTLEHGSSRQVRQNQHGFI